MLSSASGLYCTTTFAIKVCLLDRPAIQVTACGANSGQRCAREIHKPSSSSSICGTVSALPVADSSDSINVVGSRVHDSIFACTVLFSLGHLEWSISG